MSINIKSLHQICFKITAVRKNLNRSFHSIYRLYNQVALSVCAQMQPQKVRSRSLGTQLIRTKKQYEVRFQFPVSLCRPFPTVSSGFSSKNYSVWSISDHSHIHSTFFEHILFARQYARQLE